MYAMYDIKEYNTQENTNTIPLIPVLSDFKDKFRLYLDYYKDEEWRLSPPEIAIAVSKDL